MTKLFRALSPIHGIGLFAGEYIPPNSVICKAFHKNNNCTCTISENGKYVNHSICPNTTLKQLDQEYYLVSTFPIYQGMEIFANYYNTPECIDKPDNF